MSELEAVGLLSVSLSAFISLHLLYAIAYRVTIIPFSLHPT